MDSEKTPLVTVIAACYNHERFVMECLEGIRNQTYANIQLIITDDCSTDHSVEVIDEWITIHEIKCHFIKHLQNKGLPKTLNEALSFAEGKYVSIISMDDMWLPEFINKFVNKFEEQDNNVGLVYGNSFLMNEEGNILQGFFKEKKDFPEGFVFREFLEKSFIASNAVMIRASCYKTIGYYNEDLYYEDLDMWTRILPVYKAMHVPEILAKYRINKSSMSNSKNLLYVDSVIKVLTKLKETYPEYTREIVNRLAKFSVYLYESHHPDNLMFLRLAYKTHKTKRNLFLLACAFFRIPYQKCQNMLTRYDRLINKGKI